VADKEAQMSLQFEVDGGLVSTDDLEDQVTDLNLLRVLRQVPLDVAEALCPIHGEEAAVTVIVLDDKLGVRVSGCCQTFVDQVQALLKPELTRLSQRRSASAGTWELQLHILGTNKVFAFAVGRIDRLVIGRRDPDTGWPPDIDLAFYGAYENGVSRRHAIITYTQNTLWLMDNGSPNGTYLNEQRLEPRQTYALKSGHQIRVGRLTLSVTLASYP
jgi:predicted component of type VI protein secretion system